MKSPSASKRNIRLTRFDSEDGRVSIKVEHVFLKLLRVGVQFESGVTSVKAAIKMLMPLLSS